MISIKLEALKFEVDRRTPPDHVINVEHSKTYEDWFLLGMYVVAYAREHQEIVPTLISSEDEVYNAFNEGSNYACSILQAKMNYPTW